MAHRAAPRELCCVQLLLVFHSEPNPGSRRVPELPTAGRSWGCLRSVAGENNISQGLKHGEVPAQLAPDTGPIAQVCP